MKKIFSILFAAMIFLSGMHISIATHICGGEIAAVKLSVSAVKATCGMESDNDTNPISTTLRRSCCHDQIASFTVADNYNPSTFHINEPDSHLLQIFYLPDTIENQLLKTQQTSKTNIPPPGLYLTSAVSLSDICVFQI